MTKKNSRNTIPLIREDHPTEYDGYPFITLIQYNKNHILTLIDNTDGLQIKAYVLDLCGPERVDEERIIEVAANWYEESSEKYPISIEFSKLGISEITGKLHRSFNIEFVTRVIGPLPKFDMGSQPIVKRRRRKAVPPGVEIHHKSVAALTGLVS